MAKNKLSDLRDHLFAALEGLSDQDHPLDLDRVKAISEVSQTIINTAKVEIEMVEKLNACSASSFFEALEQSPTDCSKRPAAAARSLMGGKKPDDLVCVSQRQPRES